MASTKLYFGYGSNLWRAQMATRCPDSPFRGIARLRSYRWLINERGYANVAKTADGEDPSGHGVWGLVYELAPRDEAQLDVNEGVPVAYEKRLLEVDFWPARGDPLSDSGAGTAVVVSMLVYVDFKRVVDSTPKREYVYRMNRGIGDALKAGVPRDYVDAVMRRFIPDGEDEEAREAALRQAGRFVDDNTL